MKYLMNLETDIQVLKSSIENMWWKHQINPDEKDFDNFLNICERLTENINESFTKIENQRKISYS